MFRPATPLILPLVVFVVGLLAPLEGARKKDGPWPAFQVGVTGVMARPTRETIYLLTVAEITPGTPAEGKLQSDDVLVAVNGEKMDSRDPRVTLGNAITGAEAKDGKLVFSITRGGKPKEVTLQIPVLGSYSETWPLDCSKTDRIVSDAAKRSMALIESGKGLDRTSAMHCLFLLSTGEKEHLAAVARLMKSSVPEMTEIRGHTWNNGYILIALGEYYLRTGDPVVRALMKLIVDDSFERECVGGWGHWDYLNPGYVRSGLVNAAGGGLFTGIVLARECGIEMADDDFEKTLRYFYRFAGYGGVPYGDQRPSGGGSTNGKSGMLAVGLSLLPGRYHDAARATAIEQADSYDGFEGGHTGNFTNVMWRALSVPHVPESHRHHYRRHQDKLRWYYELCRQPNGGFRMLPAHLKNDRYASEEWGMTVALSYTAGWKKLRITGCPPGKHSKVKAVPQVFPKSPDFLKFDHAEGFKEKDFSPELQEFSRQMPWAARKPFFSHKSVAQGSPEQLNPDQKLPAVDFIAKHLRHRNPLVRCQAACAIGYHGDEALDAILKGMKSGDARVRQAAMRGLSGYMTFFMEKSPFPYSQAGRKKVLPLLVEVLRDHQRDPSELDAALFAISESAPEDLAANFEVLVPYLKSNEWWLRTSAFLAICESGKLAAPVVTELIECFVREKHGWPREFYHRRLKTLLREDQPELDEKTTARVVEVLGEDFEGGTFPREHAYVMRGNWFYEHRNIHILLSFAPEAIVAASDHINQVLANMGDPKLAEGKEPEAALAILNGDKYGGPGLLPVIEKMSRENQVKFLPGLKALYRGGLEGMVEGLRPKKREKALEPLALAKAKGRKILKAHEPDHEKVEPTPPRKISYTKN